MNIQSLAEQKSKFWLLFACVWFIGLFLITESLNKTLANYAVMTYTIQSSLALGHARIWFIQNSSQAGVKKNKHVRILDNNLQNLLYNCLKNCEKTL